MQVITKTGLTLIGKLAERNPKYIVVWDGLIYEGYDDFSAARLAAYRCAGSTLSETDCLDNQPDTGVEIHDTVNGTLHKVDMRLDIVGVGVPEA